MMVTQRLSIYFMVFLITAILPTHSASADETIPRKVLGPTKFLILEYNFPWPVYGIKPPWRSAMAQAEALDVLVRAYELTNDSKYVNTAKLLLNSLFVDVKNGGVTYKTPTDGWWYELYAGDNGKQPRVLNGMLYTLVALADYYNHTKDHYAKFLFNEGLISLRKNLPLFDSNQTSGVDFYYDILKTPNKVEYHIAVMELLSQLYQISHLQFLKDFHDKWDKFNVTNLVHQVPPRILLDNSSVPYVDYGNLDGIRIGLQRNPVTIDHVAISFYEHYRKFGDEQSLIAFLNNANWIVKNAVPALFWNLS